MSIGCEWELEAWTVPEHRSQWRIQFFRGAVTPEVGAPIYDYPPKTKLWEGNVFTGVCHSVHKEEGRALPRTVPTGPYPRTIPPRRTTEVGRTHPTGMLSYFAKLLPKTAWKWKNLDRRRGGISGASPWIRNWLRPLAEHPRLVWILL